MSPVTIIQLGMDTHVQSLFEYLSVEGPRITVIGATNIDYDQESEVLQRYNHRYAPLGYLGPFGPDLIREPHDVMAEVSNRHREGHLLLDNLNMWTSNIMLRYNSDEELAYKNTLRDMSVNLHHLALWVQSNERNHLTILTQSLEEDFTIKTGQGKMYQKLIFEINNRLLLWFDVEVTYLIWQHNTLTEAKVEYL